MTSNQTSIVFGVGPGLGWALSHRFASLLRFSRELLDVSFLLM